MLWVRLRERVFLLTGRLLIGLCRAGHNVEVMPCGGMFFFYSPNYTGIFMALPESITINGNNYSVASLSQTARDQIGNVRAVDAEVTRLQMQLAIAQTARNAYVSALTAALPEATQPVADADQHVADAAPAPADEVQA